MGRIYFEALAQQRVAVRIGLGPEIAGVDIVKIVEMQVHADRLEHPARIRRVAIGEDETAAWKPRQQPCQALVGLHPVEWDIVNVGEEIVGVDVMLAHQAGESRSMLMEMRLLD